MNRNLGRQWQQPELSFDVHRGISVPRGQKIDTQNLGTHWTHAYDVAEAFSSGVPENRFLSKANHKQYILHGQVPISSYQDSRAFRERHAIAHNPLEEELPVKHNSPVTLTGITRITDSWGSSKTRTFKKPKETKA